MKTYIISLLLLSSVSVESIHAKPQQCVAMHGTSKGISPKTHALEGVNPSAPKGGTLHLGAVGTYDSLNPFVAKGIPGGGFTLSEPLVIEKLMRQVYNEPFSLCGLVAESMDISPDRKWVVFKLNSKAKFQDGSPIESKDVLATFEALKTKGRPNLQLYYSKVDKAEALDSLTVKFTFKEIKDDAGKVGLGMLQAIGVPAACYSHMSARIGDAQDGLGNGILTDMNDLAKQIGIKKDMQVSEATRRVQKQ
jgi:ABC-type oligopeptide transport system substrate-binding subunit